jgi:PKD repeat protein
VLVVILSGALVGGCLSLDGPQARIEVTPLSGVVPLVIHFDGTGSTASTGISTYTWDFGTDDPVSHEASGTYTYTHAGTFSLTLTVRAADGSTDQKTVMVEVEPAVWVTDANLNLVYKLDMQGTELDHFDLPVTEPHGITIAEAGGESWLFVACHNGGNQRILRIDPITGNITQNYSAPAQSPLSLTYGATGQKQLWHVDGLSRKIYRLNRTDCQVYDSYGQSYFKATSPQVGSLPFLWKPQGLDWTPEANAAGHLWYFEGENRLLYKIKIIPVYDIMSGTQLQIVDDPVNIPIFSVSAIDMYDGMLWVVDVNSHAIIEVDPTTGVLTGTRITGFPGAAPAGLEIQH